MHQCAEQTRPSNELISLFDQLAPHVFREFLHHGVRLFSDDRLTELADFFIDPQE